MRKGKKERLSIAQYRLLVSECHRIQDYLFKMNVINEKTDIKTLSMTNVKVFYDRLVEQLREFEKSII